jgi:hypothetical protein
MKKIAILTLSPCIFQGRLLETDAAKSGSNEQNATSGAMKSVRVQTIGKYCFDFSATLKKYYAHLP